MNVLTPAVEATTPDAAEQGESVVLPLQFVVAPDHGRFHPASLSPAPDGTVAVRQGMRIGEVRNHTTTQQIHSPFGGRVDTWLVSAGQIVTPGQPLCSLDPTPLAGAS
jgi:multidrug efflux pump subunit AcrA (membrane-fusion protein)